MLWTTICSLLADASPFQTLLSPHCTTALPPLPTFQFSKTWDILGPFQIGTREAVWGADPLEHHGGFPSLDYSSNATFRSSLPVNGTASWSTVTANLSPPDRACAGVDFVVDFDNVEWERLRDVYGWAAYQWQAWAKGHIIVQSYKTEILTFFTPQILEFWIDDVHYFGGDLYAYQRAPVTLHLDPGVHRLDVRLVRDVRSMGGVDRPTMSISLSLRKSLAGSLHPNLHPRTGVLISDTLNSAKGSGLASPWASIVLRNDGSDDIYLYDVEATHNACLAELVSPDELRIAPGQSRPIAFGVKCVRLDWRIKVDFKYRVLNNPHNQTLTVLVEPGRRNPGEPHKVTFLHPAGIVSYTILRPPSQRAIDAVPPNSSLPIMLALHGAGVEAEWDSHRLAFDPVPDLPAWVIFPTGGTAWSGDDWHAWGFADLEAAIAMIPSWMERTEWSGPGVDTHKWLVVGHSNGGQGTWYALTHRPDSVIAAAPLSGYSSIQTYVPYTFWHPTDPGRTAVVQAALSSYRHELLLSNAKGIPVLQQHGGDDDNVPPYHSRLQSELIQDAGASSDYVEVAGKPHYWDGVYTTDVLKDFYGHHLSLASINNTQSPSQLRNFSLVVANPADTGPKHGVHVLQTALPGQLGQLNVFINPLTLDCVLTTSNIRKFHLPSHFHTCATLTIDATPITLPPSPPQTPRWTLHHNNTHWTLSEDDPPTPPPRHGRQLGPLDSILRTHGAFQIITHSPNTTHHALQLSRNLHQYFAADTVLSSDYPRALAATGTIISLAIGPDLPSSSPNFPLQIDPSGRSLRLRTGPAPAVLCYSADSHPDLGAIFLRPLPDERLELVVWGADAAGLATAARLVPLVPGGGQPDFVVLDRGVRARGLDGVLALGFWDGEWEVARNSFWS